MPKREPKPRRDVVSPVLQALGDHGFTPNGHTLAESMRVPTSRAPVFGGIGGEIRTFGGRTRYSRGEWRCTIGPRITAVYRVRDGQTTDMWTSQTSDLAAIVAKLAHLEEATNAAP